MIIQVGEELTPFMIVLIFSILGFTDAFYSFNKSFPQENQIEELDSYPDTVIYSILNTFGEFGLDGFDWTGKIFFLLATFFNLIVLLNLVIAIISDVFSTVNA